VGWEEESAAGKKKESDTAKEERKRKHEELMADRARIRALENEVRRAEKRIAELEALQIKDNDLLAQASSQQDTSTIQELSRIIALRNKEIEKEYDRYLEKDAELTAAKNSLK
jgi:hypothetical protein